MKFEIQENEIANKNYFNFYLKNNYELLSISYKEDKVLISANVSETQKNEIIAFYDDLNDEFTTDPEYLEFFLIDKYKINAEKGVEYTFLMTAKINLLIQSGYITIEEGETYGDGVSNLMQKLERGHWHSSFNHSVIYTPINSMINFHNEVTNYIKEYVNNTYPSTFYID